MAVDYFVTTQAVIASEAKQSPSCKEEIASSQKTLLLRNLSTVIVSGAKQSPPRELEIASAQKPCLAMT